MRKFLFTVFMVMAFGLLAVAQSRFDFMQPVERTEANPQVHKPEIAEKVRADAGYLRRALTTPYVKPDFRVYDIDEALPERDINRIRQRCNSFVENNNADIAIVLYSMPDWSEYDDQEFCNDFFDFNDFGKGSTYEGAVLVVNFATHYFYMIGNGHPGYEGYVNRHVDGYVNTIVPYFRSDDYAGGIIAFIDRYEEDYKDFILDMSLPYYKKPIFFWTIALSLIISLIITSVKAIRKCKITKAELATNYERPNSFNLTVNRTDFVSTHTTKVYIPPASSSGGGGGGSRGGGGGHW